MRVRFPILVFGTFAVFAPFVSFGKESVEGEVLLSDFTHRIVYVSRPDGEIQRLTYKKGQHGPEVGAYVRAVGTPRNSLSLRILDFAEFEEVTPPPFWNAARRRLAFYAALGVVALLAVWTMILRRILRRRTLALVRETNAHARTRIEADAVARERLRISYDLHDDLQQLLAGTMCRLKAGINYLGRHDELKALAQFASARQAVTQTQSSLRHILWGLHDAREAPGTLMGLFSYAAKRFPQWKDVVSFEAVGEERVSTRRYSGVLLMILQEAVGNAIVHGHARHVRVKVEFRPKELVMTIVDDGYGFDPKGVLPDAGRLGLASMRLRAEQLGGSFSVVSEIGKGTSVTVRVPEEDS